MKALLILTLAAATGCASAIPDVQLRGDRQELSALVGRWSGEYAGGRAGTRQGTIFFELEAAVDHAHGDVLMTPDIDDQPYVRHPFGASPGDRDMKQPVRFLSIRFVALRDGTVTGALDPYWDPDRRDRATSIFRGRLDGDTIQGTYVTRYASGAESTTGRWVVRRSD
jgi:hypothetical protein